MFKNKKKSRKISMYKSLNLQGTASMKIISLYLITMGGIISPLRMRKQPATSFQ